MDSPIWANLRDWRLAETISLLANWKTGMFHPRHGKPFYVKRGELVTSVATLARKSVLSTQNVRTGLRHLVASEFIEDKPCEFYRVIRVINFGKYQDRADGDSPNKPESPVGKNDTLVGAMLARRGTKSNKGLSTGFPDVKGEISPGPSNNGQGQNQQSTNTDRRKTLRSLRTYSLYCRICGTTAAKLNKQFVCSQCLRCAECGEADKNARPFQRVDRTWKMVCGSCRGRKPRKGGGLSKVAYKIRGSGGN